MKIKGVPLSQKQWGTPASKEARTMAYVMFQFSLSTMPRSDYNLTWLEAPSECFGGVQGARSGWASLAVLAPPLLLSPPHPSSRIPSTLSLPRCCPNLQSPGPAPRGCPPSGRASGKSSHVGSRVSASRLWFGRAECEDTSFSHGITSVCFSFSVEYLQ